MTNEGAGSPSLSRFRHSTFAIHSAFSIEHSALQPPLEPAAMMRHRSPPVGLNLDSLLDTMTNGVGILIIVLCVTQVEVGRTVREARGKTPISPEELKALLDKHGQLASAVRGLTEDWKAAGAFLRSDEAQLAELERNLPKLREASAARTADSPIPGLEKKIADAHGYFKGLTDDIAARDGQLVGKQKTLADLEAAAIRAHAAAVQERALPQRRVLDPRTKAIAFYLRRGEIFPFDTRTLADAFVHGVRQALGTPAGMINLRPGDSQTLQQYFDRNDIGDRYFRFRIVHDALGALIRVELRPVAKGETLQDLQSPVSPYRMAINAAKISTDQGAPKLVEFFVWSDSFRTYLGARRVSDGLKLPGRWVPFAQGAEYQEVLGGGGGPPPVPTAD